MKFDIKDAKYANILRYTIGALEINVIGLFAEYRLLIGSKVYRYFLMSIKD